VDYGWQSVHVQSPADEIARSPAAWERLAKDWLLEVIERTPLAEIDGVPLAWIADEAPPLIAEILGQVSDPGADRDLVLPPTALGRAASLASRRSEAGAAARLPRELAALQALLIAALGKEIPERDRGEFARAVGRLAEVFGAVQSAAMESLAKERSGGVPRDPDTGLPGPAELHEWLRMLASDHRRSGAPFSILHLEIEGIERVTAGYGEDAAWRMVAAVTAVVSGQLAGRERAFRVGQGQLIVLAPGRSAAELVELADRLTEIIASSQPERSPRVTVTVGLAAYPEHSTDAESLLEAAEEAAWAAQASGDEVAVAPVDSLQDP